MKMQAPEARAKKKIVSEYKHWITEDVSAKGGRKFPYTY